MADLPLSHSDYFRGVAKEARIRTRNRYYEQNPILNNQNSALIARMGMSRFLSIGNGPIRGIYSQPGSFSDAAFVVSGVGLYRVDTNLTVSYIGDVDSPNLNNNVSMAATANIGTTPAFLFIAGGGELMLYMEHGYATGTLSGTPANNDVVLVGTTYYKFTNGSVNAGAPAGTLANPWLVALGTTAATAFNSLSAATDLSGIAGTDYSTGTTANPAAKPQSLSPTSVTLRAIATGVAGNAVATTTTGGALVWSGATMGGGNSPLFLPVDTPDDVGIVSLAYISSYVVAVPAQGQNINGRFYWIEPGETTIDPLDFATAERAPDPVSGVCVFGDQFWLPGTSTTETWYFTGNIDQPVLRVQGIVFDRGAWEGTAVQVKDSMIIVDNEGAVFQIQGGAKRISRPDIEQRIREAIEFQSATLA